MSLTTTPSARLRRRLRPRKRTIFGLFVLGAIAFAVGTWLWIDHLAGTKLRNAEAEANRLDPKWHLGDIVAGRSKVPDEENSAIAVADVVRRIPAGWPTHPRRYTGLYGSPGEPEVVQESLMQRIEALPPEVRLDDALAASMRRDLREMQAAVPLARALAGRDQGRTDLVFAKVIYGTLLGHVQNSRKVVNLLAVDSALRAHDGDIDGALDSCRAILAVGRSIGDEPFLISQLVRMAAESSAMAAAERALAQGTASDEAMARLQALLLDEADQPMLLWGVRGERAAMDDVFSKMTTGEITAREVNGLSGTGPNMPSELVATVSTAFVRYNHGLALEMLNRAVEIARRPVSEQLPLWDAWERASKPPDETLPRFVGSLTFETMPSVKAVAQAYVRTRSQMHALAATLAAERHRRAHGSFPSRLEEIDHRFLPRAPIDAFTGGPILVGPREGGLVVYSVGLDRKDGGGERMRLKTWTQDGEDLGFRLLPVAARARPPRLATLPDDVFQYVAPRTEEED